MSKTYLQKYLELSELVVIGTIQKYYFHMIRTIFRQPESVFKSLFGIFHHFLLLGQLLFRCKLFSEINLKTYMITSKNDLVIIDKHEETRQKLNHFKSNSYLTIGIDYIGKGKKLLSKGINILYPQSGITGKNSYSGFQYSILDPSFKKSDSIKIRKQVKSLVIMQGGTDSHCFIPNIIDSISKLKSKFDPPSLPSSIIIL